VARERYAAIDVRDLKKVVRVPQNQAHTLKERVLHPLRRTHFDERRALDGVSFQVAEGDFFGVVGRNGSGKSTLLKCLAGIYAADGGEMLVAGRLAPFIELGVGFNPELTARENALINAVMMGLTPAQARERFDEIIAFAELEEFLEVKLKNYSSGMQVRLAFSVMVRSDADVLLIDEVLAVGDAAFQQKCFDAFERLRSEGRTIVLVTHDMALVERFCDRALLLEQGRVELDGAPEEVARRYLEVNLAGATRRTPGERGPATIVDAWLEDRDGERVLSARHGEPLRAEVTIEAHEPVARPMLDVWLDDSAGVRVFATSTEALDGPVGPLAAGARVRLRLEVENRLAPGRYRLGCSLLSESRSPGNVLALSEHAAEFMVVADDHVYGSVALEHSLSVEAEEAR
jgi:ABC-2 type transport system ATP-binding protein